jgi:hypothetical protein
MAIRLVIKNHLRRLTNKHKTVRKPGNETLEPYAERSDR